MWHFAQYRLRYKLAEAVTYTTLFFFSLKPKLDNPSLSLSDAKVNIHGALIYIEVLGLICPLHRNLDQGTTILNITEIEYHTHHLFLRQHSSICNDNWKSIITSYCWWSLYEKQMTPASITSKLLCKKYEGQKSNFCVPK